MTTTTTPEPGEDDQDLASNDQPTLNPGDSTANPSDNLRPPAEGNIDRSPLSAARSPEPALL
ncbi:MAG: hypothetical protein ACRDRT_10750, partial [Pseudonocardiaceae bacterium]